MNFCHVYLYPPLPGTKIDEESLIKRPLHKGEFMTVVIEIVLLLLMLLFWLFLLLLIPLCSVLINKCSSEAPQGYC